MASTGTPAANVCIIAGPNRAIDDVSASTLISNFYLDTVTNIQCQKANPLPTTNQCGYDGKTKFNTTNTVIANTSIANCTTGDNSKSYCCYAQSVDGKTGRCLVSGAQKSAVNASNKQAEIYKIDDLYSDLSDVECSSKFVSAGIAIVAIVLALF